MLWSTQGDANANSVQFTRLGDNTRMSKLDLDTPLPTLSPIGLARLGATFATETPATPMAGLHWGAINHAFADELGMTVGAIEAHGLTVLGGNAPWPGGPPSVATVYSGHQFGVWAGQLGDGRALFLGKLQTQRGDWELQLKGAGPTPYSRMGDGRAVLRSSIREYLCSEAMHGLGIPTSRALALVAAHTPVRRETIETAAIVTRAAPTFLRFGHFEHFAHHGKPEALRTLFDATVGAYFPDLKDLSINEQVNAFAARVASDTAALIAQWQCVGFCHGVMNTDNMSVIGLTIDYGPFQFLDAFVPDHICNHSDHNGRYAYNQQPQVGYWNVHALAQALAGLTTDVEALAASIQCYPDAFTTTYTQVMRDKMGLVVPLEGDGALINDWQDLLAKDGVDYTIAWRTLSHAADPTMMDPTQPPETLARWFIDRAALGAWWQRFTERLQRQTPAEQATQVARMLARNPKYVLRNHLAQDAIRQATDGNFTMVNQLKAVLDQPFAEHPAYDHWAGMPPDWAKTLQISCSS